MSFPSPTPKQARLIWFSLTMLAVVALVALVGLILFGIGEVIHRLSAVLLPVAVALILAYILDPVVTYFVQKRVPRLWSVCLVFILTILVIVTALGSVLPGLRRESRKLAEDLPGIVATLRIKADRFVETSPLIRFFPSILRQHAKWSALAGTNVVIVSNTVPLSVVSNETTVTLTNHASESIVYPPSTNALQNSVTNQPAENSPLSEGVIPGLEQSAVFMMRWVAAQLTKVTTWAEFFIGFILVPVYLFYFLLEKDAITTRWPDYLPIKNSPVKNEVVFILRAINECLIVFFRGQVLVALCVGTLLTIGYLVLGLNYAVLLGMVAGVLGIVPYLGTITSLLLALAVAGIQFGDWTHPLIVLAIAAVVKLLEDFIISPRIIGERAGLHPLTIILAVMIGTTLMGGFIGALLAIPLTAAMRTLMFRYIWTREYPGTKPNDPKELVDTIS